VEYLPVEFEVFKNGGYYKAIPLPSSEADILANLPCEVIFQIKNGKPCDCRKGTEEIVDNIIRKMGTMNIEEMPRERLTETQQ
jgi:hypothetical protein